jgi:hypothetical protein
VTLRRTWARIGGGIRRSGNRRVAGKEKASQSDRVRANTLSFQQKGAPEDGRGLTSIYIQFLIFEADFEIRFVEVLPLPQQSLG